ncbi:lytic transglycosylase domain-containing protein [Roseomonas sp. OT10]|uniref:lytic transglycosylase domain-containing protein n=1 Tax=Roseomonas cutis TaxID=2897332 RepID=UPI001E314202|nr:lytic transglycosylase domain-containing protein [Roseomonas sp. OT10]UFN50790.1 lytic transglycosylase domain-containing protein [Roseomonas sp. OT10]
MRRAALALCLAAAPLAAIPMATPHAAAQPWASESQRAAGRTALAAANAGRVTEAQGIAAAADPMAAKLVTWIRLQTRGQATGAELAAWLAENPDWPLPLTLGQRAEEALAVEPDDALVLRHFARIPPRSLDGAQRYADALSRAGKGAEAAAVLRGAWVEAPGDAVAESGFLSRNAAALTAEDHWRRFDRLAFAREMPAAARVLPYLDAGRQAAAQARLALASDRSDAEALLPPPESRDLGLMAEHARFLRRQERDGEAAAVWLAAEPRQDGLSPEAAKAVWTERHVLARKLIRLGQDRAAYRIASRHGQPGPSEARQEAEFLAGWIALRRLNEPDTAREHFSRVADGSTSVITRARAGYWEGRALLASGNANAARGRWEAAAALPTAYYGQLASVALGEDAAKQAQRIRAATSAAPPADQTALFVERELTRAVLTLADLGDTRRARVFLLRMEDLSPDAATRLLIARLANSIGRPDHAVWVARRAGADGVTLLPEGWPSPYPLPPDGPEPALVLAISRQESNFDPAAVSSSNARGLMQLLPTTAAEVARKAGIPHQYAWLTANPAHNMRLGSRYLGDQLDRFGGNPALAAAAYNAGPRRVDEWLGTYGDPASGNPDLIDWIELIPFNETRNYVQRVVENVVVYRALNPAGAAGAGNTHPLARWLAP